MFLRVYSSLKPNRLVSKILEPPAESQFCVQVRWRKRRWTPRSESKIYYVREPTPIVPEEWKELKERYDHYRTHTRAIRKLLSDESWALKSKQIDKSVFAEDEKEFVALLQHNDAWNKATARVRVRRQEEEEEQQEQQRLEVQLELEEKQAEQQLLAASLIKQQQAESSDFVTMETLDDKIEELLNTRVNYNYAVDLDGKRHVSLTDGSTVIEDSHKHSEDSDVTSNQHSTAETQEQAQTP